MKKQKQEPKIDFERNRQLQKVFKQYDKTFAMVLDKPDYWKKSHLNRFQNYTWRLMRKSMRRIPGISRKVLRFRKKLLQEQQAQSEEKRKFVARLFTMKKFNVAKNFACANPYVWKK